MTANTLLFCFLIFTTSTTIKKRFKHSEKLQIKKKINVIYTMRGTDYRKGKLK